MAQQSHPHSSVAAHQLDQLHALLQLVLDHNPFYQRKLDRAGLLPLASLEDYSARVPFTTKQELVEDQSAHAPHGTNLSFPLEQYTRYHQTSGTTAHPLRWLDTPQSWQWMVKSWIKILEAAGVNRHDRVLFAFSFGPFIGFWLAFDAAAQLGALCLPGGGLSSAARLQMMLENQVTVLCCTPTYALRLAEVAAQENIPLQHSSVRCIVVAGEPGGSIPATRQRLESAWPSARIFDHHGMTEVGPVTFECPTRPGTLQILEDAYLAEVIDPATERAVAPGQTGELILTTLGRLGSPLLRYRTGDLVRPVLIPSGDPTATQAALGLEGGILGRVDDMVVVRGVNIYPSALEAIIRSCPQVAEYQVHVHGRKTLAELEIDVEPTPELQNASALCAQLQKMIQDKLALRVTLNPKEPGTLPRFEMKAKRWIRRLNT